MTAAAWKTAVTTALATATMAAVGFACGPASADPSSMVSAPATQLMPSRSLAAATVMQSAAFDPAGRQWYFAQLKAGSQTTLVITKVSERGWKSRGSMTLKGFGHGVSIGVEPNPGGGAYLYTEAKPKTSTAASLCGTTATASCLANAALVLGSGESKPFGTMIARFKWHNHRTITADSSGVRLFGPNGRAQQQTPAVDWTDKTIAVRYWSKGMGRFRYAIYDLTTFKQHRYTAIARVNEPPATTVMQGWGYAGRTFYRLEGEAYSADNPAPGDATLTAFDTGGVIAQHRPETAGSELDVREPEGTAMAGGRLCFGFSSGVVGHRKANLYCKS